MLLRPESPTKSSATQKHTQPRNSSAPHRPKMSVSKKRALDLLTPAPTDPTAVDYDGAAAIAQAVAPEQLPQPQPQPPQPLISLEPMMMDRRDASEIALQLGSGTGAVPEPERALRASPRLKAKADKASSRKGGAATTQCPQQHRCPVTS